MKITHVLAATAIALAANAHAQSNADGRAEPHPVADATTAANAPTTDGEVRKVDKEQGKVTLRHGPITNLDMPGMTMVFRVTDPKFLDAIKPGDKVKFAADKVNGALTVTAIEVAK